MSSRLMHEKWHIRSKKGILCQVGNTRYVDDIFVGFSDETSARQFLVKMSEHLRRNGLSFNEQKTRIVPADELSYEEGEVDRMFDEARSEIEGAIDDLVGGGYGFQGDWIHQDDLDVQDVDVDLVAVRSLLSYETDTAKQAEKIDRFCLPLLRGAGDRSAIDHVIRRLDAAPHLTRLYFSYLNHFSRAIILFAKI